MLTEMLRWKPQKPDVRSSPGNRSVESTLVVLRQFNVDSSGRYRPAGGATFCNFYVWDATTAMGCEIPHWFDPVTGQACRVGGKTPGDAPASEMDVNTMEAWLRAHGAAHGWSPVAQTDAQEAANRGEPVVVIWPNPVGHGHVGMLMPSGDRVERVIQAGRKCGTLPTAQAFGGRAVSYWWHP